MKTKARRSVFERIDDYNRGRRPDLVARKYRAMATDAFVFFRATAHLFWEDWPGAALDDAPLVWCCGDLHIENFGSYRGDNNLTYFDLNDFDEAALAPATRDLARLLTSTHLAAESLSPDAAAMGKLETTFLDSYVAELATGKARWIERANARGMVRDLLRTVKARTRPRLLASRTVSEGGRRRLRIDNDRTFAVSPREKARIRACLAAFAATQPDPDFFRVLDAAGRIAGQGSLGVERYVVLVRGPGGARRRRLLDLKAAHPSTVTLHLTPSLLARQPRWDDDSVRIVEIQRRMQAIPPALLAMAQVGPTHFVVRELQPSADKLALSEWDGRLGRLRDVLATMGQLTAWSQLRAASRDGVDGVDALIDFARPKTMRRRLVAFARDSAHATRRDWREFRESLPQSGGSLPPEATK